MMRLALLSLLLLCVVGQGSASQLATNAEASQNPIRRVVVMLQAMGKKMQQEGEEEEVLFDKFMCYCKNSLATLEAHIADEENKIPQLESAISNAQAELKAEFESEKQNQDDMAEAKTAMADATANRERENKDFVTATSSVQAYLDALAQAIPQLEKGLGGAAFLQTDAAAKLKLAVTNDKEATDLDHQTVMSFLEGSSSEQADGESQAPGTGEVVGILKQIEEDYQKQMADLKSEEEKSAQIYSDMMKAKIKLVKQLVETIEHQTVHIGDLKVNVVTTETDLHETEAALEQDKKLKAQVVSDCDAKPKEWAKRKQLRQTEMVAIGETIKILNDDDALDLFKKTLPSPSLIQVQVSNKNVRQKALDIMNNVPRKSQRRHPGFDFIALALSGKKADFSKVIQMCDAMIKTLKAEAIEDVSKKESCNEQISTAEDKGKDLEKQLKDLQTDTADIQTQIDELKAEVKDLKDGVTALDTQVAEATVQRKAEHEEYAKLITENGAAKQLLRYAETRLNKFYNPKAYKRTLTTTEAPPDSPYGFLQVEEENKQKEVSLHMQEHKGSSKAPPLEEKPEGFKQYETKSGESEGVLQIIQDLWNDLDLEDSEAKFEEKEAQKEYEVTMSDSADKRAADLKSMAHKQQAMASLDSDKAVKDENAEGVSNALKSNERYLMNTHHDCDWLLENIDIRKQARNEEIEAIKNAKAVLQGADFSLLQSGKRGHLRGH